MTSIKPVLLPLIFILTTFLNPLQAAEKSPREELSKAICSGNEKKVKAILQKYPEEINEYLGEYTKIPPLVEAAREGKTDLFPALLNAGADIECTDSNEETALIALMNKGHGTTSLKKILWGANYLIQKGANINAVDKSGKSALIFAAEKFNQVDVILLLIQSGAYIDQQAKNGMTPLFASILGQKPATMNLLIDQGAELVLMCENLTPLCFAAKEGGVIMAKEFVEKTNTDPNEYDGFGETPLICAAMNGHISMIKYLLSIGADVNAGTSRAFNVILPKKQTFQLGRNLVTMPAGSTALTFAKRFAGEPVVKFLEEHKAIDPITTPLVEWSDWYGF